VAEEPGIAVSAFDLIAAFREILERAKKRVPFEIRREEVTVKQMIEHVKKILLERSGPAPLEDLVAGYVWRQALIALVLALLELVRVRAILLRQKSLFAPITVARGKRFEEIMTRANADVLQASLDEDWA
jgi:segregation and condensation protein A